MGKEKPDRNGDETESSERENIYDVRHHENIFCKGRIRRCV